MKILMTERKVLYSQCMRLVTSLLWVNFMLKYFLVITQINNCFHIEFPAKYYRNVTVV